MLLKEPVHDSDLTLIEGCRNGDAAAFETLVGRYKDRIYRVAFRFLGNHEDAQDAAQEAFVRAYQGIHTFRGSAQVYTWLYSIVGNVARNRLRDKGRKGRDKGPSLDVLTGDGGGQAQFAAPRDGSPDVTAEQREMEAVLQECLMTLPEHYRLAFVLRTVEQLSYDEIAETLGCPRGTVKSRLNQARKLLHQELTKRGAL